MARMQRHLKPFVLRLLFSNRYVSAEVSLVHPRPTAAAAAPSLASPASWAPRVVAMASSREEGPPKRGDPSGVTSSRSDVAAARRVGEALAARLLGAGVGAVAFELGRGERYHGKRAALLDALRAAGVRLI
eukprot:SM000111S18808  [mRNA]  locus=s111:305308:305700:+ [translate_table: standard]